MGLRVFVRIYRFCQLAGFEIDIMVALCRPINAISPVQAGVEPLRRIGRGHLRGQHIAHFVKIGFCIALGAEMPALPAPIAPGPGEAVKHLLGGGFRAIARALGQLAERGFIGHRAPKEFRHAFFAHPLGGHRHPGLAKIFLRQHISRNLAEALGHFHIIKRKHNRTVGVANLRATADKFQPAICTCFLRGEFTINLHSFLLS